MRKRNFFVAASLIIGAAAAFTSCSNDDAWNGNGIDDPAETDAQQIVLQISNTGDGLTTRSGRPLESSEAKQDIDEVKLIICNNSETKNVVYVATIDDWKTSSTEYKTNGHGREKVLTIPDTEKLAAGTYTVYAIGYSDNSNYDELDEKVRNIQKEGDFDKDVALTLKSGRKGEEIFAGSLSLEVESGKGFRTPVVLNRQVAGTFFYVNNIPAIEGATKIRLVASAKNTSLILGQFANVNLTGNGQDNDVNVKYVINGGEPETAATHIICQANLSEWFTNPNLDADGNGIIDKEDNWTGDEEKYAEGSVFAGEFVIPFAKVSSRQTFTLQMVKDDGTVLRSWKVKLPASDGQTSEHTLWTWNSGTSVFDETTQKDSNTEYNIVRNHLYTIGQRTLDDPEDPGTDPDEPESLNTKQELTLQVCDNWEVIHQMEIE